MAARACPARDGLCVPGDGRGPAAGITLAGSDSNTHRGTPLNNRKLTVLSAAIGLAMSASAMGGTLSEAQYKTAAQIISARHTSDEATCQALAGNTKDVCMAEANGRESVAKAELEATYESSNKHRYDVSMAKASAAHAIANEKCDDLAGNAQDVCRKEAQSTEIAAKAEAERVQKNADSTANARDATSDADKKAATEKRDAAYAVAKEKCDSLAASAQATCIQEAKALHGQS